MESSAARFRSCRPFSAVMILDLYQVSEILASVAGGSVVAFRMPR